jgi:hypothetical protein
MILAELTRLKKLSDVFLQILERNLSTTALTWLQHKIALIVAEEKSVQLQLCFSHLPRIASKSKIVLLDQEALRIAELMPGFMINNWTLDQLARIWMLMRVPSDHKANYVKKINSLFAAAEMNEQIALYAALPLYHYPEEWITRCEEGIRSNIGTVLEAIMYHNPYPAKFLSQSAWNQLVLKAFFTEKDVHLIVGLNDRKNEALKATLGDYIQERLAANRTVAPEIYELTQQTKP